MQVEAKLLKPLASVQLSENESKLLAWLRNAVWEPQTDAREPIPYRAKVPEFFGGVRLYNVQGGGAQGALDLFIKKLQFQGVISKQDMYPVTTQGGARFIALKKADLDNLGVGKSHDDDE